MRNFSLSVALFLVQSPFLNSFRKLRGRSKVFPKSALDCLRLTIILMPKWQILRWHIIFPFGTLLRLEFLDNYYYSLHLSQSSELYDSPRFREFTDGGLETWYLNPGHNVSSYVSLSNETGIFSGGCLAFYIFYSQKPQASLYLKKSLWISDLCFHSYSRLSWQMWYLKDNIRTFKIAQQGHCNSPNKFKEFSAIYHFQRVKRSN